MKEHVEMFPSAGIPYGTWGSSFFPAWQTSGLAEVNIGQFASEAMNRILGIRKIPTSELQFPERRARQRTMAISDVCENFGFDPATAKAMMTTAGNAPRKHRLDRKEVDELAFCRYQQDRSHPGGCGDGRAVDHFLLGERARQAASVLPGSEDADQAREAAATWRWGVGPRRS